MTTWQEQVRAWHDASLHMTEKLEALNDVIQLEPESSLSAGANALIGGWMQQLQREHDLGEWLDYWAFERDYGRHTYMGQQGYCVRLSDASEWPLDSIDNLIEMLERQQQIDAEGKA